MTAAAVPTPTPIHVTEIYRRETGRDLPYPSTLFCLPDPLTLLRDLLGLLVIVVDLLCAVARAGLTELIIVGREIAVAGAPVVGTVSLFVAETVADVLRILRRRGRSYAAAAVAVALLAAQVMLLP